MPYWRWRSLFRAAAAAGHRVLWTDHFGSWGLLSAIRKDPRRLLPRLAEIDPGIHLLSSPVRVIGGSSIRSRMSLALAAREIRGAMAQLGMERPLLWIAGPSGRGLIGRLDEAAAIYDCSDDLERLQAPRSVLEDEMRLIDQADLVIACSHALREAKSGRGAPVVSIQNGVDPEHFAAASRPGPVPERLRNLSRPIIAYHGTIYERTDWDLVGHVCRAHPDWSLVFMGDLLVEVPADVARLPNLHLMGQIVFEEVPDYYRGCDAAWVPHKVNELTRRQSSLKVYEYLAAGLPTVTTDIPLDDDLRRVVGIGLDHDGVLEALRRELATDSPERKQVRFAAVRPASWGNRFAEMSAAIQGAGR
jgi:glycosyltransferase involved in cell wall biosynthesis